MKSPALSWVKVFSLDSPFFAIIATLKSLNFQAVLHVLAGQHDRDRHNPFFAVISVVE